MELHHHDTYTFMSHAAIASSLPEMYVLVAVNMIKTAVEIFFFKPCFLKRSFFFPVRNVIKIKGIKEEKPDI